MANTKVAVNITLKVTGNHDPHSSRNFTLSAPSHAIRVGRGSRNGDKDLMPNPENAWFESRVMSREHAVIKAYPDMKAVIVEDIGSMHGTFVNERRILPREQTFLTVGDTIRFGVEVSRGSDTFPPLRATFDSMLWKDQSKSDLAEDIRSVFEVEDDSESDVEIVMESARAVETSKDSRPRTFSVPDSDLSAAGSFDSDDDNESSVAEIDDYLPSSARTMMKVLQPPQQDDQMVVAIENMTPKDVQIPETYKSSAHAPVIMHETVPESLVVEETSVQVSTADKSSVDSVEPVEDADGRTDMSDILGTGSDANDDSDDLEPYDSDSLGSDDSDIPTSELDDILEDEQQSRWPANIASSANATFEQRSSPTLNDGMHTAMPTAHWTQDLPKPAVCSSPHFPTNGGFRLDMDIPDVTSPTQQGNSLSSPPPGQKLTPKSPEVEDFKNESLHPTNPRSPRAPSPSDAAMPRSKASGRIFSTKPETAIPMPPELRKYVSPPAEKKQTDENPAYNPWAVPFNPSLNPMPTYGPATGEISNSPSESNHPSFQIVEPLWSGKYYDAGRFPTSSESAAPSMVQPFPGASTFSYNGETVNWNYPQSAVPSSSQIKCYHTPWQELVADEARARSLATSTLDPNNAASFCEKSQHLNPSLAGFSSTTLANPTHTAAKEQVKHAQSDASHDFGARTQGDSGLKRKAEALKDVEEVTNKQSDASPVNQHSIAEAISKSTSDSRGSLSTRREKQATASNVTDAEHRPTKKVKTGNEKVRPSYGKYAAFAAAGALVGAASMFGTLLALPQDLFAP